MRLTLTIILTIICPIFDGFSGEYCTLSLSFWRLFATADFYHGPKYEIPMHNRPAGGVGGTPSTNPLKLRALLKLREVEL